MKRLTISIILSVSGLMLPSLVKRATVSFILISLIVPCPVMAALGQQVAAQTGAPAAQSAAARASGHAVEKPWPRSYNAPSGAGIVIYQPQAASWEDQKRLVAYAAVSYLSAGEAKKPALGTIRIESNTTVSLEERLVKFSVLKITEASFQSLSKEQIREIVAELEKTIPDEDRIIALDRVLASIDKSKIIPRNVEGVKADPPVIFFSKTPAVLVNIDGDPIWSPIRENDLKFAVNTNWDLFQHPPTNSYYLRDEATWLQASDVKGPWTAAGKLPDSFKKLPREDWQDVRGSVKNKGVDKGTTVFVSTQPAELIALQGEPRYSPVAGTASTKLLWVSNTESDVFRLGENGPVYYLVAGRWFTAPDFTGPWTFATPSLPPDFRVIPLEHPRSRVRASVPGTEQAAEAILFGQIPQTARVRKKELKAPEVIYNGNPEYAPIEGTSLARAVNTDKDIIKVGDMYYMCFDGVWFMGSSPNGPWAVTDSVPGQIYEIPPSSAAHNVTYVTVEDDDDGDDWVDCAVYAGYWGMYYAWGCAFWGTGWYYPPYYGWGGYYPIYYPPFRTYGYGSWYNPRTGFYGTAGRIYGPYGGVGFGARYNPTTGTYARGAMAWGPYGARGAAQLYNPRTGTYAATRQGSGPYGSWGSTYVQRGDDWAQTRRFTNREGTTTRVTRTDEGAMIRRKGEGGSGFIGKGEDNLYAGRDGNVYRRDENGNWNKWDNGGWNQVEKPDRVNPLTRDGKNKMDRSTHSQLERDRAARSEGSRRTRDYSSYRRSGGGNVGSYRGGGFSRGGFRGGGRR
ncbi:MAG TPA: hypothetical protein VLE20_06985 [Blastocatellia bacterium]|nr:hypothetical protein [Blastocatellia bacterium]